MVQFAPDELKPQYRRLGKILILGYLSAPTPFERGEESTSRVPHTLLHVSEKKYPTALFLRSVRQTVTTQVLHKRLVLNVLGRLFGYDSELLHP